MWNHIPWHEGYNVKETEDLSEDWLKATNKLPGPHEINPKFPRGDC